MTDLLGESRVARVTAAFLCAMLAAVSAGCNKENAFTAAFDKSYHDDIQEQVDEKIEQKSPEMTGRQRWDDYRDDVYQSAKDLAGNDPLLEIEQRRYAAAQALLNGEPLTLTDCLICCLEFNDNVQAALENLRGTEGLELIADSRFLPSLSYELTASAVENVGHHFAQGGLAFQRWLEFGKDNPIDVNLRSSKRQALFLYEDVVATALSDVRVTFYTVLLKQRQIAERLKLRDEFVARYERMVKLERARRVPERDVLTARLNVLNEDSSINELQREAIRLKMGLLLSMGLPVKRTDFQITGELEKFNLTQDQAMNLAFQRSTTIALARSGVWEQDRVVKQIIWEYLPEVRAQVSYADDLYSTGLDFRSMNNTYSAEPFAQRIVEGPTFGLDSAPRSWAPIDERWFGGVDISWPILDGLRREGTFIDENARLKELRHRLARTIHNTNFDVGLAYQSMLQLVLETEIAEEQVRISKERLRVQERLKDLGQISDDELETFRTRFFADQDALFATQLRLVTAQEELRRAMRYFEPTPPAEEDIDEQSTP